jgi:hypothetical protein
MVNGKWQEFLAPAIYHLPFYICHGRLGGGWLCVFSTDGLYDQSLLDGFGADAKADDIAVDDGAHLLDIGLEGASGDAGDLGADAAQVLGFAAMGDLIAEGGFLTGEIANAGH